MNLTAFLNEEGLFDEYSLSQACEIQRLSARAGIRMALAELELPRWDENNKRDRLTGCSMTGFEDAMSSLSASKRETILRDMRAAVENAGAYYADELRIAKPVLSTALKPEGCTVYESMRIFNQGILSIDEVNENIDDSFGFRAIDKQLTANGNLVTKTYKNEVKDILKITTKNGRQIGVSKAHMLSVDGKWVRADDIKVGDQLEYQLGTYTNEAEAALVPLSFDEYSDRKTVRLYKTPEYMSPQLAYLLGAYYANGSFTTKNRIKYHCGHLELNERVQGLWYKLFGIETKIVRSTDRDSYTLDFVSAYLREWFRVNGFNKYDENGDMIIPKAVRMSSWKSIISFITGYADNDGCFHRNTFCIDTSREKFARHMQEVAEGVGLSLGFSVNLARSNSFSKAPIYKLTMSRTFSLPKAIAIVNQMSTKAKMRGAVLPGFKRNKNPYIVESIELIPDQQTYDIEVENEHWYYLGGLKSHNTLSIVAGGVSPGVHNAHSKYHIRRIRISADDALAKAVIELGWTIHPEIGTPDDDIAKARTLVIDFPIKSNAEKTKDDVSAIEQLDRYLMFQRCYVDHNTSNTITVKPDEWEAVEAKIKDMWDDYVGVSFLAHDGGTYRLAPYEATTKEEVERLAASMKPFDPAVLQKYESDGISELDESDPACATGACPVR